MTNFLWHKVSEEEKAKIEKEAKDIMKSFSDKLSKIEEDLPKESLIERGNGLREEGKGKECDAEFRKTIFENAPETKGDFLIAEKKSWK